MRDISRKSDHNSNYFLTSLQLKVSRLTDIYEGFLNVQPPLEFWPEWIERSKALLFQYDSLLNEIFASTQELLVVPYNILGNIIVENSMFFI